MLIHEALAEVITSRQVWYFYFNQHFDLEKKDKWISPGCRESRFWPQCWNHQILYTGSLLIWISFYVSNSSIRWCTCFSGIPSCTDFFASKGCFYVEYNLQSLCWWPVQTAFPVYVLMKSLIQGMYCMSQVKYSFWEWHGCFFNPPFWRYPLPPYLHIKTMLGNSIASFVQVFFFFT